MDIVRHSLPPSQQEFEPLSCVNPETSLSIHFLDTMDKNTEYTVQLPFGAQQQAHTQPQIQGQRSTMGDFQATQASMPRRDL